MTNVILIMATFVGLFPGGSSSTTLDTLQTVQEQPVPVEEQRIEEDMRVQKINAYFEKRAMPLAGYGAQFVAVADTYGLDPYLLPAIAVRESSGGKRLMNNNPFGWGSAKIPFKDFNEAIDVVGWNLAGKNPNTSRYYSTPDNYKKMYYYNGTVIPSYPSEILDIMDMFANTDISQQ